jgi:hypothetical protein
MNLILSYIQDFFRSIDKWLLVFCAGFVAIFITLNYKWGIETKWLYSIHNRFGKFLGFYAVYAIAFIIPFLLLIFTRHRDAFHSTMFWVLLIVSPAIFAFKVSAAGPGEWIPLNTNATWAKYYSIIVNLPSRLMLVAIPLLFFYLLENNNGSFWGLTSKNFNWQPYLLMLMLMVPVIAFASTQPDFLQMYPKVEQVAFIDNNTTHSWFYKLLFEISYGLDFVTIELFFRGLLIFAFVRYVGADAILPMAVFYCSIHFGKPLFECISSFFGGILLGIIAYRTQSILGGMLVHVGIAWMMELGGFLGNLYRK